MYLLIAPITSVLKHEISELTLAAHNIKNDDLPFGVTVENATGTTYHLAIAIAFKLQWNFARSWTPLETLNSRENSLYQRSCSLRIFQRDVFGYFT